MEETYGIISLIPVAVTLIVAIATKRTTEPLLLGAAIGFIILSGKGFIGSFVDATYTVLANPTITWIILVCGLFGSLVVLLEKSGGALGFSTVATKVVKGRKTSLLTTWVLGIIVFADDYLNALAVGVAMRKVTDAFKVSREFLAYVINSTGATVCVLVPFSTWSAFMISQMEVSGVAAEGAGTATYISTLPFILYAWIAVIVVPLFMFKIIPIIGPMRKAERRAQETGQTLPASVVEDNVDETQEIINSLPKPPKAYNFVIPILVLAVVTVWSSDMLYGVMASLACCIILYAPQKLMKPSVFLNSMWDGFSSMVPVLGLIVAAFILAEANTGLGLTIFVIESVTPYLNAAVLPLIVFVITAVLNFCTGSFWGIPAIIFPIIIPIAISLDVNLLLTSGAIISAASFGSQACFYGDAVTCTCASTQIQNIDYAKNALPLIAVPFGLACIAFLVVGIIMA